MDRLVPGVSGVLGRCLCADVHRRWPSARVLREALLALRPRPRAARLVVDAATLESPAVTARAVEDADVASARTSAGSPDEGVPPELPTALRSADERRAAEDELARQCAPLGTDVERERVERRGGESVLAARVARLDDLLAASRAMRERDEADRRSWGVRSLLGAAVACERSGRAKDLVEEASAWLDGPELPLALVLRLRQARALGLSRLGRTPEAMEDLEWVVERAQGDSRAESEACGLLGFLLIGRDAGRARLLTERALLIDASEADRHRAARSLAALALVDRMQGAMSRSAARFTEALQVLEETAEARLVVTVLVNGWPVLSEIGRQDEAARWADRAAELVSDVEDPLIQAVVHANRGILSGRRGHLQRALDGVTAAAALVGGHREWELRFAGGCAYWAALLGDAARGETVGRDMPAAWRAVGDLRSAAVAEIALCETRRLAGRVDGAETMLRGAIDALDGFGDARAAADGAIELAEFALALGLPDRAALAEDAVLRARRASVYSALGALFVRARARASDGRANEAEEDARLGLRVARREGHLLLAARFDALGGRLARRRGEQAEAARLQARAVATAEDLDLPRSSPFAREIFGDEV